jgi:protein-L-isoaspartate(D-aspartate) O-methyltransferase
VTEATQKVQLLLALRNQGVRDMRVLEAIERIPRDLFVNEDYRSMAWEDTALPISCGQTISQPFIVAYMTHHLHLVGREKVLEVGTGSGYQAAVLAQLCRRVYTIERYRTLAAEAGERFKTLKIANITQLVGDGMKGWPQQAPFDRIIVTAAATEVPQALLDQLAIGGIMVIPIGESPERQELQRIRRTEQGFDTETLLPVRFVPLVEGLAREH